jgi:hypothetical protein
MALAFFLLAGELFRLGSFFLWLSLSAALSGILALLNIPIAGQIAVFINVSGILIVLERRFYERYTFKHPTGTEFSILDTTARQERELQYDTENIFRRTGPGWEIKYGGRFYTIKPSIGLFHIRNLIIRKGDWISCSELKRLTADTMAADKHAPYSTMAREELDSENLRIKEDILTEDVIGRLSLKELRQLRDELRERTESGSYDSPEERMEEHSMLEFIERHLSSVTDNRGRSRKLYDDSETDRKTVSAAINRCRNTLREHKELFAHFKSFIQAEGNSFRYLPDRPIDWQTD